MEKEMVMIALGDIILGDNSPFYMSGVRDALMAADVRIGQLEVPYTLRSPVMDGLYREPERLAALNDCMDVVTLSGNHIFDAGSVGIEDTLGWLDAHGIMHTGAGMCLEEAKKPAVIQKDGCTIGILNYNCTGPQATWAGEKKAGGAFVKIITKYSLGDVANPGGPPENIDTFPELRSLQDMQADIKALKAACDIVIVYFHKGLVHKPVKLADYEIIVSHMAVDAGADVILGSHSHILHGIEIYKGKTIYHGLGNGVTWVPSLRPDYFNDKKANKNEVFDPKAWAQQRIERFGFVPDPEYPTYPFHPEAIYTILAQCVIRDKRIVDTRCIPAIVGRDGVTRVVTRENGGEKVFDYVTDITRRAGLNAEFYWDKDVIDIR